MELAKILHQYQDPFMRKYSDALSPDQIKAFNAIVECRTIESGEVAASSAPENSGKRKRENICSNRITSPRAFAE